MTKAVIVGINTYPQSPLQGCVNDAEDVIAYLTEIVGVVRADIHPLFDDRATKGAIVSALRDMIASSRPGDHLVFHYSGHGTQVASHDLDEPDGLDECLCPFDFDWNDPGTQFRDNELAAILGTVPHGTAMTVVLDSCHSGDMSRDLQRRNAQARFLPWPSDIAFRMAKHPRHRRRRPLAHASSLIASACRSDETAADTSFQGRPNGAFTYQLLAALRAQTCAPLCDVVSQVSGGLVPFQMHPQLDGLACLQQAAFLISPPPVPRGRRQGASRGAAQVLFERNWNTKVFGMNFAVELGIALGDDGFEFQLGCNAGIPLRWSFVINGDTSQQVDIGAGFRIGLAASHWTASATQVSFDLALEIAPPFLAPIAVAQLPITLPGLPVARSLAAPASPADLLAMIQRAQPGLSEAQLSCATLESPRDADDQFTAEAGQDHFAGGLFGCRYEKHIDAYVPRGFLRDHIEVVLDPPGSGNVYFVGWDDSDPHIGQFTYHVGCAAFGGGKATFYLNCLRDPDAIRQARAAVPGVLSSATVGRDEHASNGHPRSHTAPNDAAGYATMERG